MITDMCNCRGRFRGAQGHRRAQQCAGPTPSPQAGAQALCTPKVQALGFRFRGSGSKVIMGLWVQTTVVLPACTITSLYAWVHLSPEHGHWDPMVIKSCTRPEHDKLSPVPGKCLHGGMTSSSLQGLTYRLARHTGFETERQSNDSVVCTQLVSRQSCVRSADHAMMCRCGRGSM